MRIALLMASLAIASIVEAQPPSGSPPPGAPPAGSPPSGAVRDPLALPGDNLPPPLANVIGPPMAINPNMPRPPLPAAPPLATALKAAQAALAQCHADGYEVGVAVSNAAGGMVAGIQADAALPGRAYNAMRKTLVAVEFGTASSAVRDKLRAGDFATLLRVKPNMTLLPGAIPLFAEGKLIGAIAVSGAPGGERDEVCAAAGAAAFSAKP